MFKRKSQGTKDQGKKQDRQREKERNQNHRKQSLLTFIPLSFCKTVFPCDYHFESQDHAKNIFNLRSMQTMSFFPLWLSLFYRVNKIFFVKLLLTYLVVEIHLRKNQLHCKTRLLKTIPQLHASAGENPHISPPGPKKPFLLGWGVGAVGGLKDCGDGLI